ncbi:MAG: DUF1559 domain-containing protein [Pirellulaceae bacterium]
MTSRSKGFTLVELLVVIAIVGIMVGLLMPAVQAAREAARVVQCQNHLKQIALACHNYESTYRQFPGYGGELRPTFVDYETSGRPQRSLAGETWLAQIMPFMEHGALFQKVKGLASAQTLPLTDQVREAVRASVETFNCPSRRDAKAYPLVGAYVTRYGEQAARTDYAMNGGTAEQSETNVFRVTHKQEGIWVLGKRTKTNRVFDGLSHTYLAGEKGMDSQKYESGTCFGDRSPVAGWNGTWMSSHSYVRYAARSPALDTVSNCLVCHDFGSAHPHGWNVAMADGSVQMTNYSLDLKLHHARGSVGGGEIQDYEH